MAEHTPPGMVRLRVCTPSAHWDAPSHSAQRYEHQTDPDGNVYVTVPIEAVRPLLRAGYEVCPP